MVVLPGDKLIINTGINTNLFIIYFIIIIIIKAFRTKSHTSHGQDTGTKTNQNQRKKINYEINFFNSLALLLFT